MNGTDERILDQAARWHLASEQDDMDWDGFARWLEASPRHRSAYEEIALSDAVLASHSEVLAPYAATPRRALGRWPVWLGGALAASLAAVFVVPLMTAPPIRTYTTQDGSQTVALRDASDVVLAPHSRLTIGGRHDDQLAVEGGALFEIRHDPGRSLAIAAGALKISDIGTRFEVQTNGPAVRIAVSDGRIRVSGDALGEPVDLMAGRRILFDPSRKLATVAPVSPSDVGQWREGRLTYDAAPLSLVAADLARYAGVSVTVPSPLAGRTFSGTLSIHDGDTAVRDLAQLMDLELSRDGGIYRLGERG